MEGRVEIYTLTNPLTEKVFYVGATTKGTKIRALTGWKKLPTCKKLKELGFAPYVSVIDECNSDNRAEIESGYVDKFKSEGCEMENTQYNYNHSASKVKIGKPLMGKEKKKSYNVYLEPKKKVKIVKEYGSLTLALETTLNKK